MYVTPRRKIPATVFVASSETKKCRPSEGVKVDKTDARAKAASNQRRGMGYFCVASRLCGCVFGAFNPSSLELVLVRNNFAFTYVIPGTRVLYIPGKKLL